MKFSAQRRRASVNDPPVDSLAFISITKYNWRNSFERNEYFNEY